MPSSGLLLHWSAPLFLYTVLTPLHEPLFLSRQKEMHSAGKKLFSSISWLFSSAFPRDNLFAKTLIKNPFTCLLITLVRVILTLNRISPHSNSQPLLARSTDLASILYSPFLPKKGSKNCNLLPLRWHVFSGAVSCSSRTTIQRLLDHWSRVVNSVHNMPNDRPLIVLAAEYHALYQPLLPASSDGFKESHFSSSLVSPFLFQVRIS